MFIQLTYDSQLIELWETFLLRLDAGEEGLPYYVPQSETETGDAERGIGPTSC